MNRSFYLLPGGTLREAVKHFKVTPALLQNWSQQILLGLKYLHDHRMVHTNVTGNNILLTSKDYGSCSLKIGNLTGITRLQSEVAQVGEIQFSGTVSYMSPEMFVNYFSRVLQNGQSVVGTKTDIWTFGCLCLEIMTGTCPQFSAADGESEELDPIDSHGLPKLEAAQAIIGGAVPEFLKNCSLEIVDFILCCLELNPEYRWSAEALLGSSFYKSNPSALEWSVSGNSPKPPYEKVKSLAVGNGGVRVYVGRIMSEEEQNKIAIKCTPLPIKQHERELYIFASKRRALKILKLESPFIVRHLDYRYIFPKGEFAECVVLMKYCSGTILTTVAVSELQRGSCHLICVASDNVATVLP